MTEPDPAPASQLAPPGIDATVAHPARMLNYVLGSSAACYGAVAGKPD